MTDRLVGAFTAEQVVRLTGLTMGQLAYWDKTRFFEPAYASEDRRSPYARIYSFEDVVGLRTLSILKGKYGVSLPHLREVAQELSKYSETPWADIRLKVWNRKVQFDEPEAGKTRGVVDGQYVLLPIIDVIEDVRRGAEKMRRRDPAHVGEIEQRRFVARSAPVVAGTRVPVSTVIHYLEDGFSPEDIVREYPSLTVADVQAVAKHKRDVAA
jgi:uncharacterized protein (DUF433 family)